jgi:hypothetical protein
MSPQLEEHGVPVLDQERHTEQRQWVALTGCQGNRIELSKPKHARDPLLAVPSEVAQAAQRPLQIARSRLELTFVSGTVRTSSNVSMSRSTCSLKKLTFSRYTASSADAEAQSSRQMPKACEGDPRNHRADACESGQVTSNYMTNLGQYTHRQRTCDKVQLRT